MNHEEAIQLVLTKCAHGYPNFTPTQAIWDEYAEEFANVNVHDFAVALKAARTRSRFFPTMADIWSELRATDRPKSGEGSALVVGHIGPKQSLPALTTEEAKATVSGMPPETRAALDALYEKAERLKSGKIGGKQRMTPEESEVIALRHRMITAQLEDMAQYDSDTAKANAAKLMEDMK